MEIDAPNEDNKNAEDGESSLEQYSSSSLQRPNNYKEKYEELRKEFELLRKSNASLNEEVQDFTALVFQESYKNIKTSETDRDQALLQLNESKLKIDVLNIQLDQFRQLFDSDNPLSRKQKKRLKKNIDKSKPSTTGGHAQFNTNNERLEIDVYTIPVNKLVCDESLAQIVSQWIDEGKQFPSSSLENHFNADIDLCMNFPNKQKVNDLKSKIVFYNPFIDQIKEPIEE